MRHKQALGAHGEALAARHLVQRGMVVLDRNWRCPDGEIDLVLRDGPVLVVCEVKTRRSTAYGTPLEAVTAGQGGTAAASRGAVGRRPRPPGVGRAARSGRHRLPTRRAGRHRPRGRGGLMPVATVRSIALTGAVGHLVDVQVDVSQGMVATALVGRPDASVSEGRDRCRSAVANAGFTWPATRRVTVLLSPSDIPKRGSHFDLAMAVGVLAASGQVPDESLDRTVMVGELTLDGRLRPVPGVLPMTLAASARGIERIFVPEPQAREAALVPGMSVFGFRSLAQVAAELQGDRGARCAPGRRADQRRAADLARRGPAVGPGSRRHGRDGRRQVRARGGGGRRSPPVARRPARVRQDLAGRAAAGHPARPDHRGGAGADRGALVGRGARRGRRTAVPATVPRPAPHLVTHQPARRRHRQGAARGAEQGPLRRAPARRVPPLRQ